MKTPFKWLAAGLFALAVVCGVYAAFFLQGYKQTDAVTLAIVLACVATCLVLLMNRKVYDAIPFVYVIPCIGASAFMLGYLNRSSHGDANEEMIVIASAGFALLVGWVVWVLRKKGVIP